MYTFFNFYLKCLENCLYKTLKKTSVQIQNHIRIISTNTNWMKLKNISIIKLKKMLIMHMIINIVIKIV